MSWPLKDFVLPLEKSDKPHPLGARNRSSFSIASAFARSRNPSSNRLVLTTPQAPSHKLSQYKGPKFTTQQKEHQSNDTKIKLKAISYELH
ncbi:hypothetical protein Ahy_A07g032001 isoform B [Arachis hypogaea]|uniref:Uncharacterized protein n=1 Tax=Arachis hypogaea TaxID=3818 RepID=A0A445C5S1_ARAHY|nr:hypothetical protein Ahy_A07g032001 isoform B [Arachis hypogaea]